RPGHNDFPIRLNGNRVGEALAGDRRQDSTAVPERGVERAVGVVTRKRESIHTRARISRRTNDHQLVVGWLEREGTGEFRVAEIGLDTTADVQREGDVEAAVSVEAGEGEIKGARP